MLNVVALNGRLTESPALTYTDEKVPYLNFLLAVDKPWRKDHPSESMFIACSAWRHTAEFICRNFVKGQLLAVEGSLNVRTWVSDDGENRSKMEVLVNNVHFAGPKPSHTADTQVMQS